MQTGTENSEKNEAARVSRDVSKSKRRFLFIRLSSYTLNELLYIEKVLFRTS